MTWNNSTWARSVIARPLQDFGADAPKRSWTALYTGSVDSAVDQRVTGEDWRSSAVERREGGRYQLREGFDQGLVCNPQAI